MEPCREGTWRALLWLYAQEKEQLLNWPWQRRDTGGEYRVFTTAFDVEVAGDELSRGLTETERGRWEEQIKAFRDATEVERTKAGLNAMPLVDQVLRARPGIGATTAISLLVDHSGSLKGQRAILACLLVELISDVLSRLAVRYEVLGFTTAAWKGGQSRALWERKGRPRNPGRLNDLPHIRYREASDPSPGAPWSVHNLLRTDLLKENIDGEAVFWASERLKCLEARRNLILVISDGAPVDDSTLSANTPNYLWDHLEAVLADVTDTPGFRVAGIGIDCDLSRLYPTCLRVDRLDEVSANVPEFLCNALA